MHEQLAPQVFPHYFVVLFKIYPALHEPSVHYYSTVHAEQLSEHLMQVVLVDDQEYPVAQVVQIAASLVHYKQLAGPQATQVFVLVSYLNEDLQRSHSVVFVQVAQLAIQATQFLVASKKYPATQVLQTVLLSGHYLQLAVVHLPNPTSKKNPAFAIVHFPTVSSEQTAHPAKQAVGINPVAGAVAALSQNPSA